MKKPAVCVSDFSRPPFSVCAKKNSVTVTYRHLDAVFHLCYNKDTDEPHNLPRMGCTLLLGMKEFICPRNPYYSTYVRLVNNFF